MTWLFSEMFQSGQKKTIVFVCITIEILYWLIGDIFHWHKNTFESSLQIIINIVDCKLYLPSY